MDRLRRLVLTVALASAAAPCVTIAQQLVPSPPTNLQVDGGTVPTDCPSGQVGTPPNCFPAPPAPVATGKKWTVTYSEEFSGSALDPTKLTPCFDWNYGDCTNSFNAGKE